MKTQFTPIAMRCTKEQFKAIEPKLIKNLLNIVEITSFLGETYLTNNLRDIYGNVSNIMSFDKERRNRTVYETWDEATFLKACGIEVDTYTVSKDFILEAHESACSTWKSKIENEFKELFPKVDFFVGKWYKSSLYGKKLYCFIKFEQADGYLKRHYYGFQDGLFCKDYTASINLDKSWTLATKEEVETALIAEAKRRGFKDGNHKCLRGETLPKCNKRMYYDEDMNELRFTIESRYNVIFKNGKWAEIISEPIELTLEQIADKFGVEVEQIKIKK